MLHTQLLDQYLRRIFAQHSPGTARLYESVLRRAHQEIPVGVIAAGEDELEAWLLRPGWSAKTRDTYRCPIVGLHAWLHRRGITSYDASALLPEIRVGRTLPRPTTDRETERILYTAAHPVRLWAWIAAYSGARVIELTRLDREDMQPEGIRLHGKGDKDRVVPMHPTLWAVLAELPPGPVVVGRFRDPRQLSTRCCVEFRALGIAGGIHRLRHWFATRVLDKHGNLRTVQELLGHSSVATTQIYTQVTNASMRDAVAGLPTLAGESSDGAARNPAGRAHPSPPAVELGPAEGAPPTREAPPGNGRRRAG
ncbi:MAG: tyrosine-type recombinase/integrase [Micromonosporaceae bacterium]|nr:tyrosine-type recombinase/integrase [Micromonosporaceae bacterium]